MPTVPDDDPLDADKAAGCPACRLAPTIVARCMEATNYEAGGDTGVPAHLCA